MNPAVPLRQRAIGHLQDLYTVAVGLALTAAIERVVDLHAAIPIAPTIAPYFLIYLITLVPIYHGAQCHLDQAYSGNPDLGPKPGAPLVDWILLFVESCILYGLAILISNPISFSYGFLVLLVFDATWAFGAYLAFSSHEKGVKIKIEARWAIINGVASVLLVVILVFLHSLDPKVNPVETYRSVLLGTLALARTVIDYAWCLDGYFPPETVPSVSATATGQ